MKINTVGEMIAYLAKFSAETRILKGEMELNGYSSIEVVGGMVYTVRPAKTDNSAVEYVDSRLPVPGSFEAIVL